jgi:hypothetical protein
MASNPSRVTIPLHITAGSCPPQQVASPCVTGRHAAVVASATDTSSALPGAGGTLVAGSLPSVTITVSYWSERSQPMHHVIKSLQDTTKQVIGRQATCTIRVRMLPNLRVASVLAEHRTCPERGGTEISQSNQELKLKLQLKRHASPLTMLVCCLNA